MSPTDAVRNRHSFGFPVISPPPVKSRKGVYVPGNIEKQEGMSVLTRELSSQHPPACTPIYIALFHRCRIKLLLLY